MSKIIIVCGQFRNKLYTRALEGDAATLTTTHVHIQTKYSRHNNQYHTNDIMNSTISIHSFRLPMCTLKPWLSKKVDETAYNFFRFFVQPLPPTANNF